MNDPKIVIFLLLEKLKYLITGTVQLGCHGYILQDSPLSDADLQRTE